MSNKQNIRDVRDLSKNCLDIGFFTRDVDRTLEFWREELRLPFEEPVKFNDGLTQYRHSLGESVIKINTSDSGTVDSPCGYSELYIADDGTTVPFSFYDPDGNKITKVPKGHRGIDGLGIKVLTPNPKAQHQFYTHVMGFEDLGANSFAAGNTIIFVEPSDVQEPTGHWTDFGFRYLTLHVKKIDACFEAITAAGATIGETPYSIGKIARISFVRDPHDNWIEVAQRASLAGGWW